MCLFDKIYKISKYANSLNDEWNTPTIELTNPRALLSFIYSPNQLRKRNDEWIEFDSFGLCQYYGRKNHVSEFLFNFKFHKDELIEITWSCPSFDVVGVQRYNCLSKELLDLFNVELPKYFNKEQLLNYIDSIILENII